MLIMLNEHDNRDDNEAWWGNCGANPHKFAKILIQSTSSGIAKFSIYNPPRPA